MAADYDSLQCETNEEISMRIDVDLCNALHILITAD